MTGIGPLDVTRRVDEALVIEAAALGRPVEAFRRDAYLRHAQQPGYVGLGAYDDADRLVGLAYGHTDAPGQWWHEQIAPAMRAAGHGEWLHGSFVIVEIHVHPDRQGGGIGSDLLAELLRERPEPRVMLSTEARPTRARAWYQRLGFVDLLPRFRFSTSDRPFAIMGAPLPLPRPISG